MEIVRVETVMNIDLVLSVVRLLRDRTINLHHLWNKCHNHLPIRQCAQRAVLMV